MSNINDDFYRQLANPAVARQAAEDLSAFVRDKMRFITHVPNKYYFPGAPVGALERLYRELNENGRIEMHPDAWVPRCLVDEGIEELPRATNGPIQESSR